MLNAKKLLARHNIRDHPLSSAVVIIVLLYSKVDAKKAICIGKNLTRNEGSNPNKIGIFELIPP